MRRLEFAKLAEMTQPLVRMQVRESAIPVSYLYNPVVGKVKNEQAALNEYYKEMYLPPEPPQSIQMVFKEQFVHYDRSKGGRLINEDLPVNKNSKKYGLASIKVFK